MAKPKRLRGKRLIQHAKMILKKLLTFLLLGSPLLGVAQKRITAIDIQHVASAYVDRPGDLYILHTDNKVSKFDTLGMPAADMGFEKTPTVFEPRDGARMFIYFADVKQGAFFSSGTSQGFFIYDYFAMEPVIATSCGDNQVWIVDKGDWSIKKLDPKAGKIVAEAMIDWAQFQDDPKITAVREYQNFLFLLDKNTGIIIFNAIGKQVKKIEGKDIPYFNFLGEELYYKKDDKLIFYDLFDGTTREEGVDPKCLYTLLTDARRYVVYSDRIDVFEN